MNPNTVVGALLSALTLSGFAQVWREMYREQALRRRIATDPHSTARYRTNGPLRNVDAFYEAFDVNGRHKMYLPPSARVKIW